MWDLCVDLTPYISTANPTISTQALQQHQLSIGHQALRLGYTAVCYNRTVSDVQKLQSPLHNNPFQVLPALQKLNLKQLTRLTVTIDTINQLQHLHNNAIVQQYDILAVEPLNDKALQACVACDYIDIIVVPTNKQRLPYLLKRTHLHQTYARGIKYEVQYRQLLNGATKSFFISSMLQLLRVLSSKRKISTQLLVSSGGSIPLHLRSASDVCALLCMCGVKLELVRAMLQRNGHGVYAHAQLRKQSIKSVIRPIER